MTRPTSLVAAALYGALVLAAQPGERRTDRPSIPTFDQNVVERGQRIFGAQCAFCHGANAKGGESGPDLIRSVIVLDDDGGTGLGEFLRTGRPGEGMPRFNLPAAQISN